MGTLRQWTVALFALAACLALAGGAAAIDQEGEATGTGQSVPPSQGYSIFIIGDALAGGLWAGTARVGAEFPEFVVNGRFKEDSGLARPEIYDWGKAVPKILERHRIDIAVVLIGSNDGQNMRTPTGRIQFGSPEWVTAYEEALDKLMQAFKQNDVKVYWVGLPPMRADKHNEAVKKIADLQHRRAAANGVKYVDIGPEFSNPDGSFAQSGFGIDGRFMRLRSLDGITFIKSGDDKLAKLVLEAIRADLGLAPPGTAPAVVAESPTPEEESNLPLFGQGLADGGARSLRSAELPPPQPIPAGGETAELGGSAGGTDAAAQQDNAPSPGSAAAALFTSGRWPAPKPGRIDDFRWPPAQ
jgi:hypothetical protein